MRFIFFLSTTACASAVIKTQSGLDVNDFTDTAEEEPSQPAVEPTSQPTSEPASQPASEPASQPTSEPNNQPATEPASQPTSEPSTQPNGILLYYTDQWSGTWTQTTTEMTGTENYQRANFHEQQNTLDCDMTWTLSGTTPTPTTCTDCLFEFDITATFDTSSIVGSECTSYAENLTFSYAYNESYTYTDSYGTSTPLGPTLLYKDANSSWAPFVAPNNPNIPAVSTFSSSLNYDETTDGFSYTNGYLNYEYYYSYY
jgi:hypothetical protein